MNIVVDKNGDIHFSGLKNDELNLYTKRNAFDHGVNGVSLKQDGGLFDEICTYCPDELLIEKINEK